jgi:hypothetical protein
MHKKSVYSGSTLWPGIGENTVKGRPIQSKALFFPCWRAWIYKCSGTLPEMGYQLYNKFVRWFIKSSEFQLILFLGSLTILWSGQAAASENSKVYLKTNPQFRISNANDVVQPPGREPTDRETSNLMTLEFISSLIDHPPYFNGLISEKTSNFLFGSEYKKFWTGFEITHTILTPDHPEDGRLKPKERAPAGFLLYGIHTNGETQDQKTYKKIGGWAGIIGPLSRTADLQNWVHVNVLRGSSEAACWKNEMGNTPLFIVGIDQSKKILEYHPWPNDDLSLKAVIKKGLYLGTSTSAASLVEFQFGWNPDKHNQYGVSRIGPQYTTDISLDPLGLGPPLSSALLQSLFVFSSLRMDLVVHDQTLTERDITPRPMVFKLTSGYGIVLNLWNYPISVTLAATIETRRYDEQKDSHSMVTLSLSGFFPPVGGGN